jgi:hypothetical protein
VLYLAFAAAIGAVMETMGRSADVAIARRVGRLSRAAHDSATPRVEGVVENFHPAPPEGHQNETFTVDAISFSYSDYVITGGYNQTRSHGGLIDQGKLVRITYVPSGGQNTIVRLELADST